MKNTFTRKIRDKRTFEPIVMPKATLMFLMRNSLDGEDFFRHIREFFSNRGLSYSPDLSIRTSRNSAGDYIQVNEPLRDDLMIRKDWETWKEQQRDAYADKTGRPKNPRTVTEISLDRTKHLLGK